MTKKLTYLWLVAGAAGTLWLGCSNLVSVDRSKVPDDLYMPTPEAGADAGDVDAGDDAPATSDAGGSADGANDALDALIPPADALTLDGADATPAPDAGDGG